MGKAFAVISTAVVTATLTSAFWIFAYNTGAFSTAEAGKVTASGDIAVVDPASGRLLGLLDRSEVLSQYERAAVQHTGETSVPTHAMPGVSRAAPGARARRSPR